MEPLQAIERRLAAIIPGKWEVIDDYQGADYVVVANNHNTWIAELHNDIDGDKRTCAEFIACAPADIGTLLAEVKLLRQENAALKQVPA